MQNETIQIKAVIFHLESTLFEPQNGGAGSIKSPSPAPDAEPVFEYLRSKDVRLALVSRNSLASLQKMLADISYIGASDFITIISRECLRTHSPAINPVALAVKKLNLSVHHVMVVAAEPAVLRHSRKAGTLTVSFDRLAQFEKSRGGNDLQISQLLDLKTIVRQGIPLPPGKLPNDLLREYLNGFVFDDPSIIINPGVGEDTAAVNVASEEVLVLKSDPITFATDSIGQYAVLINANDIATSGATPRWLLTTLLFPCGVTPYEIRKVIN